MYNPISHVLADRNTPVRAKGTFYKTVIRSRYDL